MAFLLVTARGAHVNVPNRNPRAGEAGPSLGAPQARAQRPKHLLGDAVPARYLFEHRVQRETRAELGGVRIRDVQERGSEAAREEALVHTIEVHTTASARALELPGVHFTSRTKRTRRAIAEQALLRPSGDELSRAAQRSPGERTLKRRDPSLAAPISDDHGSRSSRSAGATRVPEPRRAREIAHARMRRRCPRDGRVDA
jgi:hypothetical protein